MDDSSPNDLDLEDELLSGVSSEALLNDIDDIDLSLSINLPEKKNNPCKDYKENFFQSLNKIDTVANSSSPASINNRNCDNANGSKKLDRHKKKKRKSTKSKKSNNLTKGKKKKNTTKNRTQFSKKAINSWITSNIPSLLSLDTKQFNINKHFNGTGVAENSIPSLLNYMPGFWTSASGSRNIDAQNLNNITRFKNYELPTQFCEQNILNDGLSSTSHINSFFSNSFSHNLAGNDFLQSEISNISFNEPGARMSDNYCHNQNFYKEHSNPKFLLNHIVNDCQNYRNNKKKKKELYRTPSWQNEEDINCYTNSDIIENELRRKQLQEKNGQVKMKRKRRKNNGFLKKSSQMNNQTIGNNVGGLPKKTGPTKYSNVAGACNSNEHKNKKAVQTDDSITHWIDKKYVQEMEERRTNKINHSETKVVPAVSKTVELDDKREIFGDLTFRNLGTLKTEPDVEIIDEVKPYLNFDSSKSMISTASDSEKNWSYLNGTIVKIRNLPSGMTVNDLTLLCLPVGSPVESKLYFPKENAAAIRFRERSTAENFYNLFHNRKIKNHTLEVIIV